MDWRCGSNCEPALQAQNLKYKTPVPLKKKVNAGVMIKVIIIGV
jgi:hypothetical protein